MNDVRPKWLEVVRFELAYQLGRKSTWLLFGVFLFPLVGMTSDALVGAQTGGIRFNAPLGIAEGGVFTSMIATLLVLTTVVGDAATRDVRTRLEPLMHAAPISPAAYVGGRFLGAFTVAAMLLVVVPLVHVLVPLIGSEVAAEVVGPFRPVAYLQTYVLLILPNTFVAVAAMFALAAAVRHPLGSWVAAGILFVWVQVNLSYVGETLGRWELAMMLDPVGATSIDVLARTWTPGELNERLIGLEGNLLWNRALWLAIGAALLALTHRRFEFGGDTDAVRWWQRGPLRPARSAHRDDPARPAGSAISHVTPVTVPRTPRRFGAIGRMWQTLSVARDSLREMTPTWVWVALALLVALQMAITLEVLGSMGAGTPVLPTTDLVVRTLGPGAGDAPPPVILAVIMLSILLAGELVWRERDANMDALADAAPVPDGIRFTGKVLALWLVLAGLFGLLMLGGALAQIRLGWYDIDLGLYLRALGLRLVTPLLFALFALSVHVLVNRKHVGHVIVLLLVAPLIPQLLGLEHPLLLLGSRPDWRYSPISGFEPFLGPVLWFGLYWAAWALLLAFVARLFWVRGVEEGFGERLRLARRRFSGARVSAVGAAAGLVLLTGAIVFYNTNLLNAYRTSADNAERWAEYERRYGRYEAAPQPRVAATELDVEIHPDRREADVRGVHHLVNRTRQPIDTIHVAVSSLVETGAIELARPARAALLDDELGHRIYALEEPLQPGDSTRLSWRVRYRPRGFPARAIQTDVVGNGSFIRMAEWMPLIGYQRRRELAGESERREHGLPTRSAVPALEDLQARHDGRGMERIDLTVTVGTSGDQIAVAPGELLESWTEAGRRYFRYETAGQDLADYAIFSGAYAVREARWNGVALEVFHHPAHDRNVPSMIRGMEASLEQLTERFGPYSYDVLRMVEYPAAGGSLHAASGSIWYQELFSRFDSDRNPYRVDMPFAVTAHEVAHQFQPAGASVEGRALLSESFAWYAAMGVIEEEYGADHLARFLDFMRRSYLTPRSRADVPLLRAADWFLAYRKGPFAMYALREYVGQDSVDLAWRRLRERHASQGPPFATSLDLYRELRAVTPDSLHTLLGDLLERNTFWELTAAAATAEPTPDGQWRVTLDIEARKVVVDTVGAETDMPMDDVVEIGIYARGEAGGMGEPLYLAMHRIVSGAQTLTVAVPERPARAGIDPRHLLIDVQPNDNVVDVVDIREPSPERD